MTDATSFEIIEISSPYSKTIQCAKQGNVLVSVTKITMFGLGRIQFPEQAELSQLHRKRHENQRKFSMDQKKLKRMKQLERLEYNWRRSQGNLKAVRDVGLRDSEELVKELLEHLLMVGQSVSETGYQFSKMDAPSGRLHIQSHWQVLDDGRKYLATVIFMSDRSES